MTALAARTCGDCTVCCSELKIDTPEFRKKPFVMCRHNTGTGCGIYESRFPVCRSFLCGWRLFAELDEGWRPDRSGVIVMRKAPAELPPAWHGPGHGLHIDITAGEAAVLRPGFAEYVLAQLDRGVAVYLSAQSPATLLNEHLQTGSLEAAQQDLARLYRLLHAARWKRGPLMLWPAYRLQLDQQRHKLAKKSN